MALISSFRQLHCAALVTLEPLRKVNGSGSLISFPEKEMVAGRVPQDWPDENPARRANAATKRGIINRQTALCKRTIFLRFFSRAL